MRAHKSRIGCKLTAPWAENTGKAYISEAICAILMRRRIFDTIGLFSTEQAAGEIIDWTFRMRQYGLDVKKIDMVSADRRVHGSNFGRTRRNEEFKDFAAILRARIAGKAK